MRANVDGVDNMDVTSDEDLMNSIIWNDDFSPFNDSCLAFDSNAENERNWMSKFNNIKFNSLKNVHLNKVTDNYENLFCEFDELLKINLPIDIIVDHFSRLN